MIQKNQVKNKRLLLFVVYGIIEAVFIACMWIYVSWKVALVTFAFLWIKNIFEKTVK